jgi:hypothetical protein
MASRFYLTNIGASAVNPSFDAGWEQTGQADRVRWVPKLRMATLETLVNSTAITVPITTTQDILCRQFVSDPIPPRNFETSILFGLVIRVFENANTNNVTLAAVLKLVSQDGQTARGTLFSTFTTDTEFPLSASAATRIVNNIAVTNVVSRPGDRLVLELGGHAAAPPAAGSYTMRFGSSAATDFALTSALTTDLNPWAELSVDIFGSGLNNYQFASGRDGNAGALSFTDKIR